MKNQNYYPDQTWKNVWTVLRSNKKDTITLSCKEIPEGVSPKWKKYNSIITLLCIILAFSLYVSLRGYIDLLANIVFPIGWSNKLKFTFSFLFVFPFCILLASIIVPLSFRFSIWIPAHNQTNSTVCK